MQRETVRQRVGRGALAIARRLWDFGEWCRGYRELEAMGYAFQPSRYAQWQSRSGELVTLPPAVEGGQDGPPTLALRFAPYGVVATVRVGVDEALSLSAFLAEWASTRAAARQDDPMTYIRLVERGDA